MTEDMDGVLQDRILAHLRYSLNEGRDLYFVVHTLADGDAVASAFAMSVIFQGRILIADTLSKTGKLVADFSDIVYEVLNDHHLGPNSAFFYLDVSSPQRINDTACRIPEPIIIDHHTSQVVPDKARFYNFPLRSSNSEIIYEILKRSGVIVPGKVLSTLLLGIITDTSHMRFADHRCASVISEILRSLGTTMEPWLDALDTPVNHGERIACLKALQRMQYRDIKGYVVAKSYVSSFEGSAGRSIIAGGADAVLVASPAKKGFRISGRANHRLVEKGLDLGGFLNNLSNNYRGDGGGHKGAAGFIGIDGNYRRVLEDVFKQLCTIVSEL